MAAAPTTTWLMTGVNAIFPREAKMESVQIGPSLTIAQGTVLGEYTPINDSQVLTIGGTPTGGTFTLTYTLPNGTTQTTAAIAYNAAASAVQTALRALPAIGTAAAVTGGALPGATVTVTFSGALGLQPINALTADISLLTGGSPTFANAHTRGINAGTYAAYNSGNSDGTQVAKGILQYNVATNAAGIVTLGNQTGGGEHQETYPSCPMFVEGTFATQDLTGLDSTAVTALGRLIQGTVSAGQLRMP